MRSSQLADMKQQIAELDKTVAADKDDLQATAVRSGQPPTQSRALTALRDELEKQAQDAAARAMTEQQRRAAVESQLADEKKLGDRRGRRSRLLNQNVDQLKAQLAAMLAGAGPGAGPGARQGRADRQPRAEAERRAGREGAGAAAIPQRVLRQAAPGPGGTARHPDRRRPVRVPERGAVSGWQCRPDLRPARRR